MLIKENQNQKMIKKKSEPKDGKGKSEVDKEKSEPNPEKSIAERTKLRRKRIAEIEKEEKNISKVWFRNYFTKYQDLSDMYKKLCETEGTRNEAQVYLIKEALNKIKEDLKYDFFKNEENIIKDFEKVIDIIERILYFNQLDQLGQGLKILTPNQILSRLPIILAQLNTGNNSEKVKN